MASYRSMPAENPFLSSDDEEVLYDDAGGYGDNGAGVYDPKDAPMGVAADGSEPTYIQGKDDQSHFNSDPFYKSLFHEIDSSNSDANYSSSSTTSESISVSDIDDMPTPTIYFEKDELDAIVEDDFEEDDHDDAECTIRYDRVEEAVILFKTFSLIIHSKTRTRSSWKIYGTLAALPKWKRFLR